MNARRHNVVLVHGLWMTGVEMRLLGRRLARRGYRVRYFRYRTVRRTPAVNARRLRAFISRLPGGPVHLVAHSLGGLVLLHMLESGDLERPGRVVLLGSPVSGSAAARWLHRYRLGRLLLGYSYRAGLDGRLPAWRGDRELGVIAGTLGVGAGLLFPGAFSGPSDGTVAVSETRLAGAADHITVPASHFGLLLSRRAAARVAEFLAEGRFRGTPDGSSDQSGSS